MRIFNYRGVAAISGATSGIAVAVSIIGIIRHKCLSNKIDKITKAIDDISDDVDLTVPEDIVEIAVKKAAKKACEESAERATKKISDDINKQVKDILDKSYRNIEDDLRKELEGKITMATLDDIEKAVVNKVAERMMDRMPFSFSAKSDVGDVVRVCAESGMAGFEIKNIIDAMNRRGE